MNMSFEDQIRERAYHIWLSGGMADGHAVEHWMCAEQAMRGEIAERYADPEVILTKAPARKAAAGTGAKSTAKTAAKSAAKSAAETIDKTTSKTAKKAATKPAAKVAVAKAPRASRTRKVELSASV